jgi:ubiquinone/menaquinone biosynthesis C-methylase UbiE
MTQESEVLQEWREQARYWERHGPTIKQILAPVTRALIEDAGIVEGFEVLDVAGGPGEPSLTIAEVVGPKGSVTCTDAIAEMVHTAEREASRLGLANVKFRQCTADSLPFDDNCFDVVVCRLGVMFFPDPLRGIREMLRVARPGGTLSLAVWGKSELNPFSYTVTNVTSRYVKTPPADMDAPGAFRFAESGKLARLLEQAGAARVSEHLLEFRLEAGITPAEFWTLRSETSGTLRKNLETISKEVRDQIATEVQNGLSEFFPGGLMNMPAQMIVVTGKKTS